MIGAGLLARNAVDKGLRTKPWVKTSLAPGSKVVTEYLNEANLTKSLNQLGFTLAGYGCMTCIGNSGPLPPAIEKVVDHGQLAVAAVLSGNRNFEARVHNKVRSNYLASPPLVIAYALAGKTDIDLTTDPIGDNQDGEPVYLRDIWPSQSEINQVMNTSVQKEMFQDQYKTVFDGDEKWQELEAPTGERYDWDEWSTYARKPPFFENMNRLPEGITDIEQGRILAIFGNSVTTDHISPAGGIASDSPAAEYLGKNEVNEKDFNTYGSRRGNHEVMMRGTFANVRIRNSLVDKEGGWTKHMPTNETMTIWDAADKYKADKTPLIIFAGQEYGTGSSRDWAAKGPALQGVKAVIAESFERIHRSNLIGMGILPLEFIDGENVQALGLAGDEIIDVKGISEDLSPRSQISVTVTNSEGETRDLAVLCRIDTGVELEYYKNGGILQYVLRGLLNN
jgi:aconitate hydratase